jgi:hypothetical protein
MDLNTSMCRRVQEPQAYKTGFLYIISILFLDLGYAEFRYQYYPCNTEIAVIVQNC